LQVTVIPFMINVLINPQTTCKLPANENSGLPNAVNIPIYNLAKPSASSHTQLASPNLQANRTAFTVPTSGFSPHKTQAYDLPI
jgi:hypothetical protein